MVFYMQLTLIEIRATYIVIDNKNPHLDNAIKVSFFILGQSQYISIENLSGFTL